MNKRKDSASRQPGINSFFSKSQRTEGNGGADRAACPRRPANVASVPSAVRVQPVRVQPVDKRYAENLGTKIPRVHRWQRLSFFLPLQGKKMLTE